MTLGAKPSANVTVAVASDDTDVATVSVANTDGNLTFTASDWETAQTVTVAGVEDSDGISEETAIANTPSGASEYSGLDAAKVRVLVGERQGGLSLSGAQEVDEGGTATYLVSLARGPTSAVTVTLTSGDTAALAASTSSLTFTDINWDSEQTVTLTGVEDDDAGDEMVTVTHALTGDSDFDGDSLALTVAVTDNDAAGLVLDPARLSMGEGDSPEYLVSLGVEPSDKVRVVVESSDKGAATVTPAWLEFTTDNWDTAQTVRVTGEEDADTDDEAVTVGHTASGADEFVGVYQTLAVGVEDDEEAGLVLFDTQTLAEDGETAYEVKLSKVPTAAVTVGVTLTGGNTVALTLTPAALTFSTTDWDTGQTVTLTGAADDDPADETATVTHAATGASEYAGLSRAVAVSVEDDETAALTLSVARLDLGEEDADTNYTVALAHKPKENVTVELASSDTGAATVAPEKLTFTADNFGTAQPVTVTRSRTTTRRTRR